MAIIERMCLHRSVPATAAARFVVSDNGDILSPKYAPEITAPAAKAGFSPSASEIATSATPIVPITVHELPTARATTAQMTAAVT